MILNKEVLRCHLTLFPYSLLSKELLITDISETNHKTKKNFDNNYLNMACNSMEFDKKNQQKN